jgi:hypothetical protein
MTARIGDPMVRITVMDTGRGIGRHPAIMDAADRLNRQQLGRPWSYY